MIFVSDGPINPTLKFPPTHPSSSYWAETEPNYEGKCLSVFWRQSNRKWVANKCSAPFGAICELEISP